MSQLASLEDGNVNNENVIEESTSPSHVENNTDTLDVIQEDDSAEEVKNVVDIQQLPKNDIVQHHPNVLRVSQTHQYTDVSINNALYSGLIDLFKNTALVEIVNYIEVRNSKNRTDKLTVEELCKVLKFPLKRMNNLYPQPIQIPSSTKRRTPVHRESSSVYEDDKNKDGFEYVPGTCEYMFKKGDKGGEYCGALVVADTSIGGLMYCRVCARKAGPKTKINEKLRQIQSSIDGTFNGDTKVATSNDTHDLHGDGGGSGSRIRGFPIPDFPEHIRDLNSGFVIYMPKEGSEQDHTIVGIWDVNNDKTIDLTYEQSEKAKSLGYAVAYKGQIPLNRDDNDNDDEDDETTNEKEFPSNKHNSKSVAKVEKDFEPKPKKILKLPTQFRKKPSIVKHPLPTSEFATQSENV